MLTDKEIQNAKPRAKLYRLSDGDGLHLEISPAGGKLWRLRYRFAGKEKMLALGRYPEVRGPDARKRAGEARRPACSGSGSALVLVTVPQPRGTSISEVSVTANPMNEPQRLWRRPFLAFIESGRVSFSIRWNAPR